MEYERKVKEIAVIIGKAVMDGSAYQGKGAEHYATQILSLDGIEIRAENQDLPLSGPYTLTEATSVRQARQDMLKEGFVKVIPKGR
ncbi:MAG TPA: hypothetical protein VMV76_04875 [Dehalococcoidia bacterium]|nr:hypothetical protein [Dehalococcoidia bacterium]